MTVVTKNNNQIIVKATTVGIQGPQGPRGPQGPQGDTTDAVAAANAATDAANAAAVAASDAATGIDAGIASGIADAAVVLSAQVRDDVNSTFAAYIAANPGISRSLEAVTAASTANLALTGAYAVDGRTMTNGDRYLARAQTAPAQNGIYVYNSAGSHTRAPDMDAAAEFVGACVSVTGGNTLVGNTYQCQSVVTTVGTSPVTIALIESQTAGLAAALTKADNLAGVASKATARTNLGLGSAATYAVDALPVSTAQTAALAGKVSTATIDTSSPWYYQEKQIVTGEVDVNDRLIWAYFTDGTSVDFSIVPDDPIIYTSDEKFYLDYKQIAYGVVDSDDGVMLATFTDGTVFSVGDAGGDAVLGPVVFVGDSLTARGYPLLWSALSGRSAIVDAIGGQQSRQIAARIGAISVPITVSGDQIVSGANTITQMGGQSIVTGTTVGSDPTLYGLQFLSNSGNGVDGFSRVCTIGATRCTISIAATGSPSTSETYTFTPDGDAILPAGCPAGTPLIVERDNDDLTHVFWVGRNNYYEPNQVLADTAACVARLRHDRFVVMSVLNGTGSGASPPDGVGWVPIFAIEQALADAYPRNFLNIRRALIDQGLSRAGLTATAQDLSDIAGDMIPSQMKADGTHLTTTGDAVVAEILQEFITLKGI
jgi:hypothetical protein